MEDLITKTRRSSFFSNIQDPDKAQKDAELLKKWDTLWNHPEIDHVNVIKYNKKDLLTIRKETQRISKRAKDNLEKAKILKGFTKFTLKKADRMFLNQVDYHLGILVETGKHLQEKYQEEMLNVERQISVLKDFVEKY